MLVSIRKHLALRIKAVYFSKTLDANCSGVDLVIYWQAWGGNNKGKEFSTIHISLEKEVDDIFADIRKNTRYEIRRAENRDDLDIGINLFPDRKNIDRFSEYYDVFSNSKDLARCNVEKMVSLNDVGGLSLSSVRKGDSALSMHAHIVDGERARLLYSASHLRCPDNNEDRSLVGRANRFLHWKEMILFKHKGFRIYDFGGISSGGDADGRKGIDEFKKGFGGKVLVERNVVVPVTLRGVAGAAYLNWIGVAGWNGKVHLQIG